jgi:HAD superfamily hydrolase (TIGR01509 family)
MKKLKALIFDVDGTLAETERDGHRLAFNLAFAEVGLDWQWSIPLYRELLEVSGGKERIGFYIDNYCPDFQLAGNLDDFIADLHQRKTRHYRQLLSQGAIPLRPGVRRLIREAYNQGIRLAIATTSALANVLALLEHTLEPSWFEIIAAGDIVPAKKPAPDIYYYVLQQMNLSASECLVFEDSKHGLTAATQAGLKTIITVNDYTKEQDFSEAILVLTDLGEPPKSPASIKDNKNDKAYIDVSSLQELLLIQNN